MSNTAPEPIDLPDALPELDDGPDTADEPPPFEDTEPLLDPSADESDAPLDNELATDLDIGIDLALGSEATPEPSEELVLDIGELLDDALERAGETEAADEPPGPDTFDVSIGIASLPETADVGDDDEPPDTPDDIASEFPELDADDPSDGSEPNWLELESLAASDHPLRDATRRWHAAPVTGIDRPCRDLALAHGEVLVGGHGLWRTQGASAEPLIGDEERIDSIAVTMGSVVYVNSGGSMRRLLLDGVADSTAVGGALDESTLLVATVQDGERIVALSSSRAAFESADGGRSWSRIVLPGRVLALPRRADRLLLLVEQNGDRMLALHESEHGFRTRRLEQAAELVTSGDTPVIDTLDRVIVLMDAGRGMLVSCDEGEHFQAVPGCAGATSVCLGRFEGSVRAWVALYSDWTGKTDIVMVDPVTASAERIAELTVPGSIEDAEPVTGNALCWDPSSTRLWIAGAQGLLLLEPEDLDGEVAGPPL
jgi:hypothetical protein